MLGDVADDADVAGVMESAGDGDGIDVDDDDGITEGSAHVEDAPSGDGDQYEDSFIDDSSVVDNFGVYQTYSCSRLLC